MSGKINKTKSKHENPGSSSKKASKPEAEKKKEKKSIKFHISLNKIHSEESFSSALSHHSVDEEENRDDLIRHQEVNISVLKKYIQAPARERPPRTLFLKSCKHSVEQENRGVFSTTSSRQLFEILRSSPTPSDFNINLINATYLRKLGAVKEAIRNGADVNTILERQTPLMIATETGDTRLVAYLLTVPEINPDIQNNFGCTPLIVAVRNGFDPIVRLLLKHNTDVNLADNMGKTPLHCALFQQRLGLVKLLLAFGADYEKSDCFGERPMYTAAVKKPNIECLKTLLKIGALPDYHTMSGVPLLSRTILNGTEFKIIETLVKYGASVNSQDLISYKTPLHFAALINDIRVAEFLVNNGADTNMRTTYNFTPLDEAITQRSQDVKSYLSEIRDNNLRKNRFNS